MTEYHDINNGNRKTVQRMNVDRSNFKPVVFDKYIYVFGGKGETGALDECERCDSFLIKYVLYDLFGT